MKNIVTIIFILVAQSALAQWYIGGKAATSFSNYKTKTPWKEVSNSGLAVGFTAYRQINTHYGLHLELEYIQKGYFHKVCNTIYDKLEANYLEIPIMFDYTFIVPSLKNFKGHADLGIYAAYWLNGKYKTKGFDDTAEDFDFKKSGASRFDVGPNVGGRIEYILKKGSISLDVRYEIGLLDLQKRANDNTRNTNRALVIGLNYLKPLGH